MGIVDLMKESGFEYEASKTISAPHAALIVQQSLHLLPNEDEVKQLVNNVKSERLERSKDSAILVYQNYPSHYRKLCHVHETKERLTG